MYNYVFVPGICPLIPHCTFKMNLCTRPVKRHFYLWSYYQLIIRVMLDPVLSVQKVVQDRRNFAVLTTQN